MNRKYLSNESVLLDVRRLTVAEGRGKGVDLFRITNSAGLDFDVIIDRAMAIGQLRVDGQLISYTSETGIVHPCFYEKDGFGWLRSFGGGFLATCGLAQVGEPCEGHGLHGRIDNIPAEQVSWRRWWEDDVLWAEISGTMYEVTIRVNICVCVVPFVCVIMKRKSRSRILCRISAAKSIPLCYCTM